MEDLSQHLLDVAENGLKAGATRIDIRIDEDPDNDTLTIEIEDNGTGMSPELVQSALDPFVTTRTTRRVGLGLPFLAQAARAAGGDAEVWSAIGEGTKVRAVFGLSHIDRQPLGDIAGTLIGIIVGETRPRVVYEHKRADRTFKLDTDDLQEHIDPVPLDNPEVLRWIREYVTEGLHEVGVTEI